ILDLYNVIIENPLIKTSFIILLSSYLTNFFSSKLRPSINVSEETKNKLDNLTKIKELIKTNSLTTDEYDYIVTNDKELKKLKSNFYKSAKQDDRIEKIEFDAIDQKKDIICNKKSITYNDFDKLIIKEEIIENHEEIDVKIFIIAPVLIKGRKDPWKGICNNEYIEFRVLDKSFLESVYLQLIRFSNGTFINCKMKISTISYFFSEKVKISRDIIEVINFGDGTNIKAINKYNQKKNNQYDDTGSLF
ncbi:MAG: hypothetical protein WCO98_07335, partial [bacterium]